MKKLSLIFTLLGILTLVVISNSLPAKPISSQGGLASLIPNQKISLNGFVIKETYSKNNLILHLNNNIVLLCPSPCPSLLNKNISAIAKYEPYNNNRYLKVLKIMYN